MAFMLRSMLKINYLHKKFYWTRHVKEKMRYYNLSEQRLKRVFRHPQRLERGIAKNTIAVMQVAGSKKHPYEIWLMYQLDKQNIKIISAWRYPGRSKPGDKIPVPEEIAAELGIKTQLS